MSSPSINVGQQNTSLATIMNLVRSLVNDTQAGATDTPGEGQIFTNNPTISPFTQPFLNSSIRELYRELRNVGQPTLLKDNVIISNLPTMTSPENGPASPDPSVQVYLSIGGYFDGLTINPEFMLPNDLIYPEKVFERTSGTNDVFLPLMQPQDGLPSIAQVPSLGMWEWRGDNIWFPGATTVRDIRLRYWAQLPQFFSSDLDFDSTYVPILDCTDAVAYKTAVKYATMLGSPGLPALQAEAANQMFQLKNANTRRAQRIDYHRIPYGNSDGDYNNGYYSCGWGN